MMKMAKSMVRESALSIMVVLFLGKSLSQHGNGSCTPFADALALSSPSALSTLTIQSNPSARGGNTSHKRSGFPLSPEKDRLLGLQLNACRREQCLPDESPSVEKSYGFKKDL